MSLTETTPVPSRVRKDGDGAEWREPQLGLLDRPMAALLRMDAEKWAWAALLIVSLLIRVIGLGDRSVSHDESLHTLYAWKLYDGQGYQHQPMMHGPLKFELTALVYFILGVSDWTSRLTPALFGLGQVWLAWLTRRWLGRTGALLLGVMFSISPALLYHSRYIRDEIMLTALLVLLAVGMLRYLETRSTNWLYAVAVTLALALTTMEASFIFGAVFGIYLILSLGAQLWLARWPDVRRGSIFRMAAAVSIPAVCFGLAFLILKQNLFGALFLAIGVAAVLVALVAAVLVWRKQVRSFPEVDLIVLLGTLVLPFLSAVILKALGWQISQFTAPSQITPNMITQGAGVLAFCFVLSIVIGYMWLRDRWLIAAGFFWAIELLLFSTFLTNGQGIFTGLIGSLGYWIDQQEVMRGNQPWFYFFMQVPLYEFLPLVLSIGATIAWLARGRRPASPELAKPDGDNGPLSAGERVAAKGARIVEAPAGRLPSVSGETRAVALFLFWTIGTWIVFTYVGEKMPWHVVYFATPMSLLGAWGLGRLMDAIDWRAVRSARGLWLFLLVPLFLVALKNVLPTSTRRPFVDVSVDGLSVTIQWVFALVVTLALAYLLLDRFSALGWAQTRRMLAVTLSGILLVLTIAVSLRFSFVLYDYATEPMVYAHGTPDIKLAMAQVEEISRKIAGDHALEVRVRR